MLGEFSLFPLGEPCFLKGCFRLALKAKTRALKLHSQRNCLRRGVGTKVPHSSTVMLWPGARPKELIPGDPTSGTLLPLWLMKTDKSAGQEMA